MIKFALLVLAPLVLLASFMPAAFAHEEVQCGDVTIVAGWGAEPPLVGQLNSVELTITRGNSSVTNAVAQLETSISKGSVSKPLEFEPTEEVGVYEATIIPSQSGQYAVVFKGTVAGQTCNTQVAIEDAEDTRRFNFPDTTTANPGIPDDFLEQFQAVIGDLTAQVDQANTAAEQASEAAQAATESANEQKLAADRAYLFGIIGVGVGVAGIAIAVVALSRRASV
jgi:hypothetical protein